MRARIYAVLALGPAILAVVSLLLATAALADPCPSQQNGGC